MAIKLDYATRETVSNLRRNLLLTTASMLTVAVSLAMVGGALLLRYGVNNATERWKGGIEFELFMNLDASPEQMESLERRLQEHPDVESITFVTQAEQYELFKRYYADQPEVIQNVEAGDLPPSYRVNPDTDDGEVIRQLAEQFSDEVGVREVAFAAQQVDEMLNLSSRMQIAIWFTAAILFFAASLLIFNTIRMAIFARRREIEVMKLVGATNWFIRVPFMLEGLVQGLLGAAIAFGLVYFLQGPGEDFVRDIQMFGDFRIFTREVSTTGLYMLGAGSFIGAVGAGVAVTRFLDV
ncbi:MAG TPA: permease-like cell division protein FtsX [Acidimicrobiales bacterium]|nr:permease-like cell division protein FtsX [Acidimicrobiales bacterium]